MKTLGNILWHFPFFGFISAAITYLLGLLFTATVVGAPVGLGLMEFGKFLLAPFGHAMVSKSDLNIEQNQAWKTYSTIVMVLYFPLGLFFTIVGIFQVVGLCLSFFGIPVALVIAKSLGTYLNPVNKKCVSSAVATELERRKGVAEVEKYLVSGDSKQSVQSASTQSATEQHSAHQPEPAQFSTPAPALSATAPEAETLVVKPDMPPDIPSERSSSTRTNGPTTPKWLIPAVAGGVTLVLVAGGIVYFKQKTQREVEPLAQQELAVKHARQSKVVTDALAQPLSPNSLPGFRIEADDVSGEPAIARGAEGWEVIIPKKLAVAILKSAPMFTILTSTVFAKKDYEVDQAGIRAASNALITDFDGDGSKDMIVIGMVDNALTALAALSNRGQWIVQPVQISKNYYVHNAIEEYVKYFPKGSMLPDGTGRTSPGSGFSFWDDDRGGDLFFLAHGKWVRASVIGD